VLRRFTVADADDLVELDSDPEVMRFITGGRPTPREEIVSEVLPAFLGYYQRYAGMASGPPLRERPGSSLGLAARVAESTRADDSRRAGAGGRCPVWRGAIGQRGYPRAARSPARAQVTGVPRSRP